MERKIRKRMPNKAKFLALVTERDNSIPEQIKWRRENGFTADIASGKPDRIQIIFIWFYTYLF